MPEKKINLGLVQRACTEDLSKNICLTFQHIEDAARRGAQIVVLQELFNTTYFPRLYNETFFEWAEPIPGALTDRLCRLAKSLNIVLVAPFFERRAPGIYHNSLVVIDADGTLMGCYRKNHIPDDPGFYEKFYFTPGDEGYPVFDTKYAKIGPLICWDQWYPEAARIMALKGAELLIYPTAIGMLMDEDEQTGHHYVDAWQTMQRSHAIANGCFVASINRTGQEGEISFWGHSFIVGPFGEILARAGTEKEVLINEIDLSAIENQRRRWPFFRDRRIDTYKPILKKYFD